jgi:hypothetical protein
MRSRGRVPRPRRYRKNGGEREPEYEQRHHEQRRRSSARFTERRAGLMQQIQRERRGDQQQCQHAEPDHIAEIGITAPTPLTIGAERSISARERTRRVSTGGARDARTIRAPAACRTRATLCAIAALLCGQRPETAARYRLRALNVSHRSSMSGSKNRVRYSASLTVLALMYMNVSAPRKNVI